MYNENLFFKNFILTTNNMDINDMIKTILKNKNYIVDIFESKEWKKIAFFFDELKQDKLTESIEKDLKWMEFPNNIKATEYEKKFAWCIVLWLYERLNNPRKNNEIPFLFYAYNIFNKHLK